MTRHRTPAAVLLCLAALAAGLATRPAEASVPPAPGWRVTARSVDRGGIETQRIFREDPVEHGVVAVIPRSQLHRMQTMLASNQLIGGTGRDLTTNMCARVHCHVAVNGDRWDLFGHDAGRITGASAIGGELIATQPIPPADPYAHLLIGRDGSMDGTIAYPIIAPDVTAGELTIPVAVNRQPNASTSVITRRYSTESRTPPGTVEFILTAVGGPQSARILNPVTRRDGSGPIPASSLVVAANGPAAIAQAETWWDAVLAAGSATYNTGLGDIREIVGGSPLLLDGNEYGFPTASGDGRQPRTIIGWDATRIWLVTVDGRQPGWSSGITLVEAAQLMRWLGASDALNLDGGGSSTFVDHGLLANRPSLGYQPHVAESLVILPPEGRIGSPPPARALDPACPPGQVPPSPFRDTGGNLHERAITCMAWWDVAAGTGPGAYSPGRSVRRDQMATFLARMLYQAGVPFPAHPPDAFPDDDGSLHEPLIDAMAALGVVGGRADGTYGPSGPVTRGQMATFLARALPMATRAALANTTDYFNDDSGDVHEQAINQITEAGIAGGSADGRYRDGAPVRRDQMASFLARVLASTVQAGHAAPPG
jgi:hypothetical protein